MRPLNCEAELVPLCVTGIDEIFQIGE